MCWKRIEQYNRGRDPERLVLKYNKMAEDALAFFRGTAHLFYEDWPADRALREAPATWVCGDLHLENFGTYRADNRLVYFDFNDFDESCLGPATWDIGRLVTSVAMLSISSPVMSAPRRYWSRGLPPRHRPSCAGRPPRPACRQRRPRARPGH